MQNDFVLVYAFTVDQKQTQIPLVLKNKPHFLKGLFNLPGGKIEDQEDIVDAALRELKEETGLEDVESFDPAVYYPPQKVGTIIGDGSFIHCVSVPVVYKALTPKATEIEKVAWYNLNDASFLSNLIPNLRLVIPLICSGAKGWTVIDVEGSVGGMPHAVELYFDDLPFAPHKVVIKES